MRRPVPPWAPALILGGALVALSACGDAPEPPPPPALAEVEALATPEETFAARMAGIDFYVAEAARLAADRSANGEVRALAAEFQEEHDADASRLAEAVKAAVPPLRLDAGPPEDKLALLDGLLGAPPASFDRAYVDQQISAAEDAANTLRRYGEAGRAGPLKAFAAEALPLAERRLARIQDLRLNLLSLQPPRS